MALHTFSLRNWTDIVALADTCSVANFAKVAYVFRGQENHEWTLTPSLHLAASKDGVAPLPSAKELLEIESTLQKQFCATAPIHLPPAVANSTHAPFDWWGVMRHYGVPTRLLDWTRSFYVALYFAVRHRHDKDGAVYILHVKGVQDAMIVAHGAEVAQVHGQALNTQALSETAPPVISMHGRAFALLDRMTIQQGLFMLCHNVSGDIESLLTTELEKKKNSTKIEFQKVVIPAALKRLCIQRLQSMNLTGASLFPGLDGIGKQLDELVRARPLATEQDGE